MVELLGQASLRTLLLAAVVQLGLGVLGMRRPQSRLLAWTIVLAASIVMPVLQQATPLRLSVLPEMPNVMSIEAAGLSGGAFEGPTAESDDVVSTALLSWLDTLYLLVAGALLLRLSLGLVLSLRLLRRAAPFQPDWAAGTSIRISRDIAAPVTVAHIVLLPPDAVDWPTPMRAAVLAHERAHIARGDFAMLLISQINRAVFWFSPLAWWLHRRLATLTELASDDQAMTVTGDRLAYATILLEMGRRPGPTLRGVAMARRATLKLRIERILLEGATAGSVRPMQQAMLAVGAIFLAIIAASSRPIQTIASFPAPIPSSAPPIDVAPEAAPLIPIGPVTTPASAPRSAPTRVLQRPPNNRDVSFRTAAVAAGRTAKRNSEAAAVPNGHRDVAGGQSTVAPPARPISDPAHVEPEPSCTGIFVSKPDNFRTDAGVDIVQATYLRESDGTPWLRLRLGSQRRTMLTGMAVERISFRATVVTRLPRGTVHVSGTTSGAYGSIGYVCAGSARDVL